MLRFGTCAALLAVVLAPAAAAVTGPATIRITNRETRLVRVDVGAPGRSPGDMEIITQSLFNKRITPKAIGHADLVCTFTIGISRSCRGTYFLPRGKLVVGGSLRYRQFYELAVLGGTGLYNNARGTLTVTRVGRKPSRDLLFFRLAG